METSSHKVQPPGPQSHRNNYPSFLKWKFPKSLSHSDWKRPTWCKGGGGDAAYIARCPQGDPGSLFQRSKKKCFSVLGPDTPLPRAFPTEPLVTEDQTVRRRPAVLALPTLGDSISHKLGAKCRVNGEKRGTLESRTGCLREMKLVSSRK